MRPLAIITTLLLCSPLHAEPTWTPLWNGKDLSEWTTWLAKPHKSTTLPGLKRDTDGKYLEPVGPNQDSLKVFTIVTEDQQPAIRISGEIFGELRSKVSLKNYRLRLQFKWGQTKWPPRDDAETPRDSGLLYHVHAEPGAEGRTWARSIELQIQEHDVGDLYAVGSQISVRSTPRQVEERVVYDYNPQADFHLFSQIEGQDGRCIKQPDNEKPSGEWNTVEIVCLGEDSIHIVNGKVVMRLQGARRIDGPTPRPVSSGPILLQSEGAEIFYRNIEYTPITTIPTQYRE